MRRRGACGTGSAAARQRLCQEERRAAAIRFHVKVVLEFDLVVRVSGVLGAAEETGQLV